MPLKLCVLALLFAVPASAQTADDLFNDQILHEVHLDVHPRDWQQLKDTFLENTHYAADFQWKFDGRDIGIAQAAIRSRGTGSRNPIKPSLLVDFQRYNNGQRFLGLKSLVLRNNAQDASMMREKLAFALLNRLGFHTPRVAYTRLFVNSEYMGLYTIVESIDENFLRTRFGDAGGYLYRYEYGLNDPTYTFGYRGPDPALYSPLPFAPETRLSEPVPGQLEEMIRAMNQAPDSEFESAVSKYLDWTEILTFMAAEAFLAESDGFLGDFGLNNFYLYRFHSSELFHIISWDRSQSFASADRSVWANIDTNVLSRRAMAKAALRNIFVSGLESAAEAAGGPGGWLEAQIQFSYSQIRQAALEDGNKHCYGILGDLGPCSNQDFENAVQALFDFVRVRNERVSGQIADFLGVPSDGFKPFDFVNPGGIAFSTGGQPESTFLGYGVIQTAPGDVPPAGVAFLQSYQNAVMISEAPVHAVAPIARGRISVETGPSLVTGIALVNGESTDNTVTFHFTDGQGRDFGHGTIKIPGTQQFVGYLHELPMSEGLPSGGSFTFTAQFPIAAFAIRGLINERAEFLMASLPVADLSLKTGQPVIPLFLEGDGWQSELVLLNRSVNTLAGTVEFIAGSAQWSLPYSIAPGSVFRTRATGPVSNPGIGWISVRSVGEAPVAFAVLTFNSSGISATHTIVPSVELASAFRTYVAPPAGTTQSLAMVNSSNSALAVTLELTPFTGALPPMVASLTLAPMEHRTLLLSELGGFESHEFEGNLRVSSTTASLAMTSVRTRYNNRGDPVIAAVSPVLDGPVTAPAAIFFPLIAHSSEYSTQFVLYSVGHVQNLKGIVSFRHWDGSVMDLRLRP